MAGVEAKDEAPGEGAGDGSDWESKDMRIGSRWQAMIESTGTERQYAGSFWTGFLTDLDSPSTTDHHRVRGGLNVLKRRTRDDRLTFNHRRKRGEVEEKRDAESHPDQRR